jgi:alkanesulfonate monooxygenase SsuD/methylene tetrahydromethanopterin reductase-like flavin-dependent oxidoreductase (luciferase family)
LQWEALGFTTEEYGEWASGANKSAVKHAFESGATIEEASKLVTELMVKTYYAAGRPEEVRDQIIELVSRGRYGYDQVAFAKLGRLRRSDQPASKGCLPGLR